MQIVIEIPEGLYEAYKGRPPRLGDSGMDMIAQAISNGTPIPDNHGRLIDADELKAHIHMENYKGFRTRIDGTVAFEYINNAPTIIEAESEEDDLANLDSMLEDLWNATEEDHRKYSEDKK